MTSLNSMRAAAVANSAPEAQRTRYLLTCLDAAKADMRSWASVAATALHWWFTEPQLWAAALSEGEWHGWNTDGIEHHLTGVEAPWSCRRACHRACRRAYHRMLLCVLCAQPHAMSTGREETIGIDVMTTPREDAALDYDL